jgi:hypothetical protein
MSITGIKDITASKSPIIEHMHFESPPVDCLVEKQWVRQMPIFDLVDTSSFCRAQVEKYIENKFRTTYGATLTEYLPFLLTMRCGNQLRGAAGISLGTSGQSFFLELYVDLPIEQKLAQILGRSVDRKKLVEIGNLVATTSGTNKIVFIVLASMLHQAGFEWMTFTATKPLLASLEKLGFEYHLLGKADPSRLPSDCRETWGTYYQNEPQLVAGKLACALDIIEQRKSFFCIQALYKKRIAFLVDQFSQ